MAESDDDDGDPNCKTCLNDVKDTDPGVFCEGQCQSWYHIGCVGITPQQYKKISSDLRKVIIWVCPPCKMLLKQTMKNSCLKTILEKVTKIKENVEKISNGTQEILTKPSYSNIVETKVTPNLPNIIIKPKQPQSLNKSKVDLETKIKPGSLGIRIKGRKELSDGKIVLKFPTLNDMEKLKTSAIQALSKDYEIIETSLRNPRVKIPGLKCVYSEAELERVIKTQNEMIITENESFKVSFIKSFKAKGYKTAFAECSPRLFQILLQNKKIFIGWERYSIYEDISVLKCYKCQQFHHKSNVCTNRQACSRCGGEHEFKDCTSQAKKCTNCQISNEKYKTQHKIEHEGNDPECPSYKYQIDIAKSRINYG